MFVTAAVLLLIGAAIWLIIRDDPAEWGYRSFALPEPKTVFSPATLRRDLMTVFRYRNIWLLFLAGGVRIYDLAAYRSGFFADHHLLDPLRPGHRLHRGNPLPSGEVTGPGRQ